MANSTFFGHSDDPQMKCANLEKSAITLIDSAIDLESMTNPDFRGTLISKIETYIREEGDKGILNYIMEQDKTVERFITIRKHLWLTTENPISKSVLIRKEIDEYRRLYYDLSSFIHGQMDMNRSNGASLSQISDYIYDNYWQLSKDIGRSWDALKTFLSRNPLLFERIPIPNMKYGSRVTLVNDVILMPNRVHGQGPIMHYMQDKLGGFILNERTRQGAYFPLASVHIPWLTLDQIIKLLGKGQKFQFVAISSNAYKEGRSNYEWKVVEMWPLQEKGTTNGQTGNRNNEISNAPVLGESQNRSVVLETIPKNGPPPPASLQPFMEWFSDTAPVGRSVNIVNPRNESTTKTTQNIPPPPGFNPIRSPNSDQAGGDGQYFANNIAKSSGAIPKMVAPRRDPFNPHTYSQNINKKVRPGVEMQDFSCQTDIIDDREILLRLISKSPDLVKILKERQQTNGGSQ